MKLGHNTKRQTYFSDYLPQHVVQYGLRSGHLLTGSFRVNAKDCKEAYATVDGLPCDVLFYMQRYQNRAIDGDEVVFEIPPVSEWRYKLGNGVQVPDADGNWQASGGDSDLDDAPGGPEFWAHIAKRAGRTPGDMPWSSARSRAEVLHHILAVLRQRPEMRVMGRVVAILKPSPRRERVVGVLHPAPGNKHLLLLPLDPRLPRQCAVRESQTEPVPQELRAEANSADVPTRTLVQACITGWDVSSERPSCRYSATVGPAGDKDAELAALRVMHGLEDLGFSDAAMACLPPLPWSITEQDVAERRDFRNTRIVSIDPPTARDLDDALSVEPLPNGNFRVGVHIADVAHFIPPGCELDKEARDRATSVYLVDRVIPMLPRMLCEELCSLNPGVDRLSFSVEWELTPDGHIKDQWFGRSIIRTCAKLSYLHAQDMIDGKFDLESAGVELHGGYNWQQVASDVCTLNNIAKCIRGRRFASGALRMDNPKLTFALDELGRPVSCSLYVLRESNQLIEEFMLLANMSVATFIADVVPSRATLRRHPPPAPKQLQDVSRSFQKLGYELDISSSATMHTSLEQLRGSCEQHLTTALQVLATKPMMLAQYFCTGAGLEQEDWRHYALNVPRYTHFTSPIRRYPDVMVHRSLAAALELTGRDRPASPAEYEQVLERHGLLPPTEMELTAVHCNVRRVGAREAQDRSSRLFLALMLKDAPLVCTAVVIQPGGDKFLPAFLPELGCECRIALDGAADGKVMGVWDAGTRSVTVQQWQSQELSLPFMPPARNDSNKKQNMEDDDDFDAQAWAASLGNLRNPQELPPHPLPLQVECLQLVTVVVGASLSRKIKGHPNDILVRLYVEGMPDGRPLPPPGLGVEKRTSVMEEAYELQE